MYNFFSNWCWFCTLGCAFKSLRFRLSALSRFSCKRIWIDHKTSSFGALWKVLSLNAKIISNFYKRSSLYSPHWGKNSQFTQNFTFWKSHSQSVNFHKSHIFKVWFFTKFTFFKHQSPRTFWIKSWICPSVLFQVRSKKTILIEYFQCSPRIRPRQVARTPRLICCKACCPCMKKFVKAKSWLPNLCPSSTKRSKDSNSKPGNANRTRVPFVISFLKSFCVKNPRSPSRPLPLKNHRWKVCRGWCGFDKSKPTSWTRG